ncbi:hypothetical protein EG329_013766 [Mollisiaceae sp. DMI_Dod_QoI]|nr:hypothetical protein EG329_013766 [Helotiales sp. DMI_Dod_QoI]
MALLLAATLGKLIYDDVKERREAKKNGTSTSKRSKSTKLSKGSISPPSYQINNTDPSPPSTPTSSYSESPIEGAYEMDMAPPPYQADVPAPLRLPSRSQARRSEVPWSPDDVRAPVELDEDEKSEQIQIPERNPLRLRVRSDELPWSPDSMRMTIGERI